MSAKTAKVLIVDDDSRNIFALSATLKSKGFITVSATSAEEALELLNQDSSVGIVLTDIMMPGTDGYDLIHMLRRHTGLRNIPVIAVTAQAMAGDREKSLQAGADDYIPKPVNVDKLLSILDKYEITGREDTGQ